MDINLRDNKGILGILVVFVFILFISLFFISNYSKIENKDNFTNYTLIKSTNLSNLTNLENKKPLTIKVNYSKCVEIKSREEFIKLFNYYSYKILNQSIRVNTTFYSLKSLSNYKVYNNVTDCAFQGKCLKIDIVEFSNNNSFFKCLRFWEITIDLESYKGIDCIYITQYRFINNVKYWGGKTVKICLEK